MIFSPSEKIMALLFEHLAITFNLINQLLRYMLKLEQ